MPDLTIRGIPPDIMDKIRILSRTERRSINSQMLLILESGLHYHITQNTAYNNASVSKETQMEIWSMLSGKWEDNKNTEDIITDIYDKRTRGRDVEL